MKTRQPQKTSFRLAWSIRLVTALTCAGGILQAPVIAADATSAPTPVTRTQTGTVNGRVFNATTGTYVTNARVSVVGTLIETLTDATGTYHLRNVPAGTMKVKASYTGQQDVVEVVSVDSGAAATRDFSFKAIGATVDNKGNETFQLDAFVVESQRYRTAQEIATNEERVSTNIKSVVALDTLGYQTDGNVGDFVRFLPGIDVANGSSGGNAGNQDNAMTVSVRGFGPENTAVMINGMPLASGALDTGSGGMTNAFQFDSLSINNASRLEIIKVATPDMPSDSPGGAINLITRNAFEFPKATYDVSVAFNGNLNSPEVFKKSPGPYEPRYRTLPNLRVGMNLPITKTLGLSFSVAQDNKYSLTRNSNMRDWFFTARTVTINGVVTPVTNAKGGIGIANPVIDRFELNDNQWREKRYSGSVGVDWRPFPNLTVNANGQLSTNENIGTNRRTQWRYSNAAGIQDWGVDYVTGRQRTATFNPSYSIGMTTDARDKEGFTSQGALTVKYRRGPWSIDGKASASESYSSLPDAKNGHFSTVDASLSAGRMDLVGITKGTVGKVLIWDANGAPVDFGPMSAWNPILNSGFQARTSDLRARDLLKQYNLDITRELDFLRFPMSFKTGVQQKEKSTHKWGKGTSWRWQYVGPTTGVPTNTELQSDFSTEATYGYNTPQYWADPSKIYRFYQQHPDYFDENYISPASSSTIINTPANNWASKTGTAKGLTTTDSSWYGMLTANLFHNRLTVITGARQTMKETNGYNGYNDGKYNFIKLATGELYRDSFYPNGVIFSGGNQTVANGASNARDIFLTDTALRARMTAAGVKNIPTQLELAPNGANGTDANNLRLAQLRRYTRFIDSKQKQPMTPQIQTSLELTNTLRLQVAYSRETRMPDIEALGTGAILSGSTFTVAERDPHDPSIIGGDGTITISNVRNQPEITNSYDVKLAWYPKNGGGRYSISYFYKVTPKSWLSTSVYNTDADYAPLLETLGLAASDYENYTINTIVNTGTKAIRKGVEVEAEQNLGVLGEWARGIDVFLTYTYRPLVPAGASTALGYLALTPVRPKWTGGISYSARRFSVQARGTYTESGITRSSAVSVTMPDGTTQSVQFYNTNQALPEINLQGNFTINKRFSAFATFNRVFNGKAYSRITDSQTGLQPDQASYRTLLDRGVAFAAGVRTHF